MPVSEELIAKLIEASPYAAIMVVVFIIFLIMYNKGLEEINKAFTKALEEVKDAYKESSARVDTALMMIHSSK